MPLIYLGLSHNSTPVVLVVMSYYMLKERLEKVDLVILGLTLIGVTFITFGEIKKAQEEDL